MFNLKKCFNSVELGALEAGLGECGWGMLGWLSGEALAFSSPEFFCLIHLQLQTVIHGSCIPRQAREEDVFQYSRATNTGDSGMLLLSVLPLAFQRGAALSAPLPRAGVCPSRDATLNHLSPSCLAPEKQPGKPRPAEKKQRG